jgi:TPR repeat protein
MFRIALVVMCLSVAVPAAAGPLQDGFAAYSRADYVTALRLWRPLAEQGNADAQYNLGLMYARGQGVPQDLAEAHKWYLLAAAQGDGSAQDHLGLMYAQGKGVPEDHAAALGWFRQAAAQGHGSAQSNLGVMYSKGLGLSHDPVLALMWWSLAVQNGYAPASKFRDQMTALLTPEQIAEAQRLAREWKPAPPR